MNTVSLSVSRPSSTKGKCLRNSVSTVLNSVCSRTIRGAHSVKPVAMSVSTRVWMKLPRADGPLCATRSASTTPGAGSFQSADVRIGTLRRRECAACRWRWRPNCSRIRANARSIVAALIAKSLSWISGESLSWLCRSISSTNAGSDAFSRFPQIRSDASQSSTSPLCSASLQTRRRVRRPRRTSSWPRSRRIACLRWNPVMSTYPRLLRAIRTPIARARRRRQFLPRCHAQPPHLRPRSFPIQGSNLREATAQHPVTIKARQCGVSPCSPHSRRPGQQTARFES